MRFSELTKESIQLLKESGRLTYRALQREFALDTETLEDLKTELIKARKVAVDEDGEILVWVGEGAVASERPRQSQWPIPLHIWQRVSVRSSWRWNRVADKRGSVKPLPRCSRT